MNKYVCLVFRFLDLYFSMKLSSIEENVSISSQFFLPTYVLSPLVKLSSFSIPHFSNFRYKYKTVTSYSRRIPFKEYLFARFSCLYYRSHFCGRAQLCNFIKESLFIKHLEPNLNNIDFLSSTVFYFIFEISSFVLKKSWILYFFYFVISFNFSH